VTRDLGQSWDIITDMAIKLVPGGHPYHALAEAAANAAREGNIAPQDVDSITVSCPGFTALTGPLRPTDLISAVSLQPRTSSVGIHEPWHAPRRFP
jgi:hypothetical protein